MAAAESRLPEDPLPQPVPPTPAESSPSDQGLSDPDLQLSSYDFALPGASIAQRPVEPRHAARLLVAEPTDVEARHLTVWDLQHELEPGDLLVVNDTRVLQARLTARRATGGAVELLVLQPHRRTATGEGEDSCWLCLARPAKRLQPGEVLRLEAPGQSPLELPVVDLDGASGGRVIRFPPECTSAERIEGLLARYGTVPLPPYIHEHDDSDRSRYQTRYAQRPGAVAAPTAGLHLSDDLLSALADRGVTLARITLHVGLGTFRPVEQEDLTGLELHDEWVEVGPEVVEAVNRTRRGGHRVIAIGTTSVRALEGVAALHGGQLAPHIGPVNLVIQPGFRFLVVQGLLTNFHLPKSSLLLLVSALISRQRLLALYAEAIEQGYRFFSYGDAMWIPPRAVLAGARPQP